MIVGQIVDLIIQTLLSFTNEQCIIARVTHCLDEECDGRKNFYFCGELYSVVLKLSNSDKEKIQILHTKKGLCAIIILPQLFGRQMTYTCIVYPLCCIGSTKTVWRDTKAWDSWKRKKKGWLFLNLGINCPFQHVRLHVSSTSRSGSFSFRSSSITPHSQPLTLLLKRWPSSCQSPPLPPRLDSRLILSTQRPGFLAVCSICLRCKHSMIYFIENMYTISMTRIHPGSSILPSD